MIENQEAIQTEEKDNFSSLRDISQYLGRKRSEVKGIFSENDIFTGPSSKILENHLEIVMDYHQTGSSRNSKISLGENV